MTPPAQTRQSDDFHCINATGSSLPPSPLSPSRYLYLYLYYSLGCPTPCTYFSFHVYNFLLLISYVRFFLPCQSRHAAFTCLLFTYSLYVAYVTLSLLVRLVRNESLILSGCLSFAYDFVSAFCSTALVPLHNGAPPCPPPSIPFRDLDPGPTPPRPSSCLLVPVPQALTQLQKGTGQRHGTGSCNLTIRDYTEPAGHATARWRPRYITRHNITRLE